MLHITKNVKKKYFILLILKSNVLNKYINNV